MTGEGGAQQALTVDPAALDAATKAYAAYVDQQVDQLVAGTTELVTAVKGGDVAAAKALYAPVRRPWERIEPVAELFPDSDAAIDSRVDDFSGPDDPKFTGFHRIEKGLWEDGSTNGLDTFADQLQTDVQSLATNVRSLQITPDVMVNGAAGLIEEAAQTKITGEEERYSRTDLDTFAANVDGAKVIYDTISPLLGGRPDARRRDRRPLHGHRRTCSSPTSRVTPSSRTTSSTTPIATSSRRPWPRCRRIWPRWPAPSASR